MFVCIMCIVCVLYVYCMCIVILVKYIECCIIRKVLQFIGASMNHYSPNEANMFICLVCGSILLCLQVPCDVFDGAFEMETFGNIQFAGMTMYINLQNMDLKVRRLTTKSYLYTEVDSCYLAVASDDDTRRSCKTRWIWYWESSNGTLNKYEVCCQPLINTGHTSCSA